MKLFIKKFKDFLGENFFAKLSVKDRERIEKYVERGLEEILKKSI